MHLIHACLLLSRSVGLMVIVLRRQDCKISKQLAEWRGLTSDPTVIITVLWALLITAAKQQHDMLMVVQELGVDITPRLQTVRVEEPPKRKGGIMVSSIEELVDKLKNEAKVL